jgi:hypothetical protein
MITRPADPALDLPALAMNGVGPGAGWLAAMYTKTHRETGTGGVDGFWQALADGAAYHRTLLTGKGPDEFDIMTPEGVRVSWKITEAHTTVDDTASKPAFPGGETADCYHQFASSPTGSTSPAATTRCTPTMAAAGSMWGFFTTRVAGQSGCRSRDRLRSRGE